MIARQCINVHLPPQDLRPTHVFTNETASWLLLSLEKKHITFDLPRLVDGRGIRHQPLDAAYLCNPGFGPHLLRQESCHCGGSIADAAQYVLLPFFHRAMP